MAQSIDGWFKSLGPITQKLTIFIVALTMSATLGVIHAEYFLLDFTAAFRHLQVWRLATNLFFFGMVAGPAAFAVLVHIYLFIMYSNRLEESTFKGKRADYVWLFITSGTIAMLLGGGMLGAQVLSRSLLLVIIWVWCRENPGANLSIMGIFSVTGMQFPWVLMAMHWLFGQGWVMDMIGIVAGHFWIFMREILPETHGVSWLGTPQFLRNVLPDERVLGGFGAGYMPASRQAPVTAPKSWGGQGRVLGSD